MSEGFSDSTAALQSPRVLVVEDDPETRHFYAGVLAADGFYADEAHNGFQAFELCRRLRADPRTSSVRVLAVTGYDDRHYPDRALEAGADHVLLKPLDPAVLVSEVRRLVPRPQPAATDAR